MKLKILSHTTLLLFLSFSENLSAQTVLDFKSFKGMGTQRLVEKGSRGGVVKNFYYFYTQASVNGAAEEKVTISFNPADFSSLVDRPNLECLNKIQGLGNQVLSVKLKLSNSAPNSQSYWAIAKPSAVIECSFFNK
jgi:hypothetical protein